MSDQQKKIINGLSDTIDRQSAKIAGLRDELKNVTEFKDTCYNNWTDEAKAGTLVRVELARSNGALEKKGLESHNLQICLDMANEENGRLQGKVVFPYGTPCHHKGCLSHGSHPCEGCHRVFGVGEVVVRAALTPQDKLQIPHFRKAVNFFPDCRWRYQEGTVSKCNYAEGELYLKPCSKRCLHPDQHKINKPVCEEVTEINWDEVKVLSEPSANELALRGKEVPLYKPIDDKPVCGTCDGDKEIKCWSCDGKGKAPTHVKSSPMYCEFCNSTGKLPCPDCSKEKT